MSQIRKFFTSSMSGLDTMNDWGHIVRELDKVLVNGFNEKTVVSITVNNGIANITLPVGHGYVANQVIILSGATPVTWNKEFRIVNVTAESISIKTTETSAPTGTITCKVAPLGYEKTHSGTHKGAYRSLNPNSTKNTLRVDNSLPPNGYNTEWAKFARVTICDGLLDIDTYTSQNIAPYDTNKTGGGNNGNGVSGRGGIHGWFKWYSNVCLYTSSIKEETTPTTNMSHWTIVGDDLGFWFMPCIFDNYKSTYPVCYGFGEIDSYRPNDTFNNFLIASDNYNEAYDFIGNDSYFSSANVAIKSQDKTGKILFKPYHGVGFYQNFSFPALSSRNYEKYSGYSEEAPLINPIDGSFNLQDILIQEFEGVIRGKMRIPKWIFGGYGGAYQLPEKQFINGDKNDPNRMYFFINIATNHTSSIDNTGGFAFDMGVWG